MLGKHVSVVNVKWLKPIPRRVTLGLAAALMAATVAGELRLHASQSKILPLPATAQSLVETVSVEDLDRIVDDTDLQDLAWVASGRHVPTEDHKGLRHEWPGLVLQARFSGPSELIHFDDDTNRYRLFVDGVAVGLVTRPGRSTVRLGGLADSEHLLRIEKISEGWAPASILGLSVPANGRPLPPPALLPRRIDVYGDSDAVGYGNLSGDRSCPGENVFLMTDTSQAWPALLAARFASSAQVTARSGIGLVRNYGGANPGAAMLQVHGRPILSGVDTEGEPPRAPAWVSIVALGDNDFSVPLQPGEAWADQAALEAAYSKALAAFVERLLDASPGRPIVLLAYPDAGREAHPLMEDIVAKFAARGAPVRMAHHPRLERTGCDWHLSLADNQALSDTLAGVLDKMIVEGLLEAQ